MVALVVLSIAAASLPALAIIHGELERQAWNRVEQGSLTTQALLEAELARLADLATLAGQRPTLRTLVADHRTGELEAYLDVFRDGADIDSIVVISPSGEIVAGQPLSGLTSSIDAPPALAVVPVPGSGAGAAIVATAEIVDEVGSATGGTVRVLRLLNEGSLAEIGQITGLHYSLLLDGKRIATTLPGYTAGTTAGASGAESGAARGELRSAGAPFYTITTPVGHSQDGLELETALSVADMQQEELRALGLFAATTLFAAAVVSAVGLALSRRLAGRWTG
jgi:hypothetical protein